MEPFYLPIYMATAVNEIQKIVLSAFIFNNGARGSVDG
jgi:hypothetical protein